MRLSPSHFPSSLQFALVAGLALSCAGVAESEEEYREFTNKEGRKIEARIISVATDRKQLRIAQRDGREFDLEVVMLSLDDQQFLRQWIEAHPVTTDYRIEVAIDKVFEKSDERRRDRAGFYRLNTEYPQYRVTIENLSRDTIASPVVEYRLLAREKIEIEYDEDERDWEFSSLSLDAGEPKTVEGRVDLEDLVYNREQSIVTDPAQIDQVIADGNYMLGEDELVGLILRVLDASGNVIGTYRSSDAGITRVNWDTATTTNANGSLATIDPDDMVSATPGRARNVVLAQGEESRRDLELERRPFSIRASIVPDSLKPDGVIGAVGGHEAGWVIMIRNRQIVFAVRSGPEKMGEVVASLPLTSASIGIKAEWDTDRLSLNVSGLPVVEGQSPGLIEAETKGHITAGYDPDDAVTDDYETPATFPGKVESFEVDLGARYAP